MCVIRYSNTLSFWEVEMYGSLDDVRKYCKSDTLQVPKKDWSFLAFNKSLPIHVSAAHILRDRWERIQANLPAGCNVTKREVENRLTKATLLDAVVPGFYTEANIVEYLLPVNLGTKNMPAWFVLPLVRQGDGYSANTILTVEMARNNAQVIVHLHPQWPEVNSPLKIRGQGSTVAAPINQDPPALSEENFPALSNATPSRWVKPRTGMKVTGGRRLQAL